MKLLVGLGNPGSKYAGTRHNIGFDLVDYLAAEVGVSFSCKWQAQVATVRMWGHQLILAKPETFMNESGRAVGSIASYFQISPEDIIVVHDDLDLDLARVKLVVNRGAGGHNGILSMISHLGSKKFLRFRFGIGRPPAGVPVSRFVLSRFAVEEKALVDESVVELAHDFRLLLDKGVSFAMGKVNGKQ